MWKWLDSIPAVWGLLIIEIGVGGVVSYLAPQYGIPIFSVLIILGIILLFRAYKKRGEIDSKTHETKKPSATISIEEVLTKLHECDLTLKDKAVKQFFTLFNYQDFMDIFDDIAHMQNGYQELADDVSKGIGKEKLSKDKHEKRHQIDKLADMAKATPIVNKDWNLSEIVSYGNLVDKVPNNKNTKYKGIRILREKSKKWRGIFHDLQHLKVKYSDIFNNDELSRMLTDYVDWSFGGSSVSLMVDVLNKFAPGLLPTEYISSGTYAPYEKVENRLTRLLEDITSRVTSLAESSTYSTKDEGGNLQIEIRKSKVQKVLPWGPTEKPRVIVEVELTFRPQNPPIQLGRLQLCCGESKIDTNLPTKRIEGLESYVVEFDMLYKQLAKGRRERAFYGIIYALAGDKEYNSDEFPIIWK